MSTEEIRVSALIPASPNQVFGAWMDERQHSAITGSRATIEGWVGGRHTAFDGYVQGLMTELDTGRLAVMTWRTDDFPVDVPDARLEVQFEPVPGGTKLTIVHSGFPEGQREKYKNDWKNQYLDPLKKVFSRPGALREALIAAARAGRLPIPGVTSARPGTVRPMVVAPPRPEVKVEEPAELIKPLRAAPKASAAKTALADEGVAAGGSRKAALKARAARARVEKEAARAAASGHAPKAKEAPPAPPKKADAKAAPVRKSSPPPAPSRKSAPPPAKAAKSVPPPAKAAKTAPSKAKKVDAKVGGRASKPPPKKAPPAPKKAAPKAKPTKAKAKPKKR